jgi:hypothetical protein
MANFINFEEQIGKLRVQATKQTEELFKENHNIQTLNTDDSGLGITTVDGTQFIASIGYDDEGGVYVKTESGEVHDLMDLETDDIVAIYEQVWYQFKEKE